MTVSGEEKRGVERRERERERERAERMTSTIQVMPSVTLAMKSYLGRDLEMTGRKV